MEPLKPDVVQRVLDAAANVAAPVSPQDIEEYERLLSERFTRDPDLPMAPQQANAVDQAEARIEQLHQAIFRPQAANRPGRSATQP
jgi:hypothetical protein